MGGLGNKDMVYRVKLFVKGGVFGLVRSCGLSGVWEDEKNMIYFRRMHNSTFMRITETRVKVINGLSTGNRVIHKLSTGYDQQRVVAGVREHIGDYMPSLCFSGVVWGGVGVENKRKKGWWRMERVFLVCLLVWSVGCVLPADLERLEESNEEYYARIERVVSDLREGEIGVVESIGEIKAASAAREAEYAATMREVGARADRALEIVDGVASGSVGVVEGLVGLGVTAASVWVGRDYTRRRTPKAVKDGAGKVGA